MKRCVFYVWFAAVATGIFAGPAAAAEYYVATNGSDAYPGTLSQPLRTIQKAASVMLPGEVCFIRAGKYREQVHPACDNVTFANYNGEVVVVTGTDWIRGWTRVHRVVPIYKASMAAEVTQVFVDGERMEVARFPNNAYGNMLQPILGVADDGQGAYLPALSWIEDDILNQGEGYWTGADLWVLAGARWVAYVNRIEDHIGTRVYFKYSKGDWPDYRPGAGSSYFITGTLKALDAEREWFYDGEEGTLYLQAPGSDHPNDSFVEARVRQHAFDLSGRSGVTISGVTIFAGSVTFAEASGCVLENCRVLYPVPYFKANGFSRDPFTISSAESGIWLAGTSNVVRNCEIAYSWGDGVWVLGTGNTVENCVIHSVNWSCGDYALINTDGTDHVIRCNTLYDACRSGLVHGKSQNLRIEYNEIFRYGWLTTDLGATYCYQTDGGGTEMAYNWVHDADPSGFGTMFSFIGIYLDGGSSNFVVHHNAVWNVRIGIQTNRDATNHEIYNNTLWNVSDAMHDYGAAGTVITNQKVYNNLSNKSDFVGTDLQNNLTTSNARFVDATAGDFRLEAGSLAIDYGREIAGITDGYAGEAPDAGAYEHGGSEAVSNWRAGSDLAGKEGTRNLALGKRVTASSVRAPGLEADKAVDGDEMTRWSSAINDPEWICVDLGGTHRIDRVILKWESAYGKAYKIQVSDDATMWRDIYSTSDGDGGVDELIGLAGVGRYIRMSGTQRGTRFGYSLWEFEVYGADCAGMKELASFSSYWLEGCDEGNEFCYGNDFDKNGAVNFGDFARLGKSW